MGDARVEPSDWLRARWPALSVACALLILVCWAFWQRCAFLATSPYPFGIDGYFYPIELRSLLENGTLYYPTAPLTLWLMAPLAAVSDPIVGAKIGAALGSALLAVPVYFLGRRASGDRVCGLLAAVLVATSVESFYLTVEFVKNGVALAVGAAYLCALSRALDRPGARRIAIAIGGFAAVVLAHKLVAVFCAICTVPMVVAKVRASGWGPSWSDRKTRVGVGVAAVLGLSLAALGVALPDRFVGGDDLRLFGSLFTTRADFGLPVLALANGKGLQFGHEVAIAAALALAALAVLFASRRFPALRTGAARPHDRALIVGPALVALLVANPWLEITDPQGLGFRLRLIAFVPLALCGAAVAASVLGRLPSAFRAALLVGFAFGWIASRPALTDEGVVEVPSHMQAAILAMDGVVPSDQVVICPERHLMFMVTWYTRAHARLRPEGVPENLRWRLLPSALISRAMHRAIDRARRDPPPGVPRPRGLHPRHRNGVVLMREATWKWILGQLPPRQRARYEEWRTI